MYIAGFSKCALWNPGAPRNGSRLSVKKYNIETMLNCFLSNLAAGAACHGFVEFSGSLNINMGLLGAMHGEPNQCLLEPPKQP